MTDTFSPGLPSIRSLATLGRFVSQLRYLGADVFREFPGDTLRILAAAGGGLACQAVALLGLYAYLQALAHNHAVLGLPARESLVLFGVVAGTTLLLLIGFAVLEYWANMAILRVTRLYQHLGTREALSVASRLPHWFTAENEPHISGRHLRQIVAVDVHHRSRLTQLLLLTIIPAVRLVLCALALLYLNAQFTLLILFAVGLPVVGLYSVGRRVADTITTQENASTSTFLAQRKLLETSWAAGSPLQPRSIAWDASLGQADSRHRQYFRRLRARTFGIFLINVANTVGIVVLVLALGFWTLLAGNGHWSLWLTYLIVLRYFLSSLRGTAQAVVGATRYLRQSQRFTAFLSAANAAADSADPQAVPCPEQIAGAFKGEGAAAVSDDELED